MFENLKNTIDFFIRSKVHVSRKNFVEKSHKAIERNNLENLYTTDVLKQCFVPSTKSILRVLDVGCKNWFYAKGEYKFFSEFCENFSLCGVEIDAYRLYSNFYNRYETAKYYTRGLENTEYIAGNLLELDGEYDYIIWFLPFVLKEPHRYWGLPDRLFYPEKLLTHAYKLLSEGGQMLIVNQGEEEAHEQKNLFEKLKIPYAELGEIKSEFWEYKHKRYAFLCKKY